MFRKLGADAVVSDNPEIISSADKLVLPGVGVFDTGMRNLKKRRIETGSQSNGYRPGCASARYLFRYAIYGTKQ